MICQRKNIDDKFFVGMVLLDELKRFRDQFPLAIDFEFVFGNFADFSDFPVKWICARQWTKGSTHR